jgi:hypothetical protein
MKRDTNANSLLPRFATIASLCAMGFAAMSVGMLFAPIDAQSYHRASGQIAVESRDAASLCATTPCTSASRRPPPQEWAASTDDEGPTAVNGGSIGYDDDDRPEYRKGIRNTDFDPDNSGTKERTVSPYDFSLSLHAPHN